MQKIYHRDMMQRIIRVGDYIVWGASRQGYGMRLARVTKFSHKQVFATLLDNDQEHRFFPSNSLVVTQQVRANLDGNVGVNTEENKKEAIGSTEGKSFKQFCKNSGIDLYEEISKYK